MASLTFLGAAQEVTGSCYLLETLDGVKVLLECGMRQGRREADNGNRAPFPFDPASIDAVVISHAHLDHSGLLPRLAAEGFKGPIFATEATCELLELMLLDSAHIQEKDAEWENRWRNRIGKPSIKPLYTQADTERYEASVEFTRIWRRVLEGETVDYAGKHIQVKGAKLLYPPLQQPRPPLYFGGSSEAAQDLAAEQVELYLTWGEPPAAVAEKIAQVREKAARQGRQVRFGIRLHVIVRETSEEAWQAADRLIAHLDDDTIARAQASLARFDSVGQQRMAALHGGSRDNLEVSPNLWAGVGLVRGGAGTALVGDGPTVAARVREYAELGIDTFIFSGYPHLEESYRVAELLFPHLDVQRPAQPEGRGYVSPFGEMVANDILPRQAAQS